MNWEKLLISLSIIVFLTPFSNAQQSVARQWNEVLLEAIRNDFARPTVHARNLFHSSIAMYDLWAVYDEKAKTFLLGKKVGDYTSIFEGVPINSTIEEARKEAISYAMFRLLHHRFQNSPGADQTIPLINQLFVDLNYDSTYTSVDYTSGNPAALGNYMAQSIIEFGLQDNSNEQNDYDNLFYTPINTPVNPSLPGVGFLRYPNRWQPLSFDVFVDQSGNEIPGAALKFLSPEWGKVTPFALKQNDLKIYERAGDEYWVYHDPGDPSFVDEQGGLQTLDYQWNFSLVSIWSSHLDPSDGVMIDISPASVGNIDELPTTVEGMKSFYNYEDGGDPSKGHALNPYTGMPYQPQIVPRADYARVLAEFWADGPSSETPPGHWFTILNYVNDHALFEKKFKGEGDILDDLEWDVKAYFILAGAVHDAAVTAWGIKGWYDYIRPISAIRAMAARGQCTDSTELRFNISGIPLVKDYIELVKLGDPLAGVDSSNVGKIKLYAWRGPDFINNEATDVAGVGWVLAENWWPYQRPTFVTPPFAGYISGHSTFSRAAAEVMTMLTGDAFFPGGMGEFHCKKNEFLVFEDGPSVDLTLQWATYRDASDQTSLSRIWGGIHPPVDDIPGRIIGEQIGIDAFKLGEQYFNGFSTSAKYVDDAVAVNLYPNPLAKGQTLTLELEQGFDELTLELFSLEGKRLWARQTNTFIAGSFITSISSGSNERLNLQISTEHLPKGLYLLKISGDGIHLTKKVVIAH